ncbi:hypothetical protein [Thermogymnomonas acidicola]|uniref:hypothetical protein n=1 Tax=Thermogymnomonas acidicola TaxID=399579 RepID=UPI0009462A09|nr:hypothetical protein [Thermogymnomonas acidicola]
MNLPTREGFLEFRARIGTLLGSKEGTEARRRAVDFLESVARSEKPDPRDSDTFYLSLWILRAIDEQGFTTRALNTARDHVESAVKQSDPEDAVSYASSMGMRASFDYRSHRFLVPVFDFVATVKRVSGPTYRLVYQDVDSGTVRVSEDVFATLVRERFVALFLDLYNSIEVSEAREALSGYADMVESLGNLFRDLSRKWADVPGGLDFNSFPPCISTYLNQMRDGVNLPHMARFTLVSFLFNVGMDREDIMSLFRTAPDYNERMTRYQVLHVTGGRYQAKSIHHQSALS